jgi:signal transduction histidine kinase
VKDVKLVWDYPIDLPEVRSYRGKLKQVVACLIDNAIKCTDHGAISIAAKYQSARQLVGIRIAGSGGRQEDFSLGLYVVKKYTEMLGGSLEVESTPGVGSTFVLQIPAPPAQSAMGQQQLNRGAETSI